MRGIGYLAEEQIEACGTGAIPIRSDRIKVMNSSEGAHWMKIGGTEQKAVQKYEGSNLNRSNKEEKPSFSFGDSAPKGQVHLPQVGQIDTRLLNSSPSVHDTSKKQYLSLDQNNDLKLVERKASLDHAFTGMAYYVKNGDFENVGQLHNLMNHAKTAYDSQDSSTGRRLWNKIKSAFSSDYRDHRANVDKAYGQFLDEASKRLSDEGKGSSRSDYESFYGMINNAASGQGAVREGVLNQAYEYQDKLTKQLGVLGMAKDRLAERKDSTSGTTKKIEESMASLQSRLDKLNKFISDPNVAQRKQSNGEERLKDPLLRLAALEVDGDSGGHQNQETNQLKAGVHNLIEKIEIAKSTKNSLTGALLAEVSKMQSGLDQRANMLVTSDPKQAGLLKSMSELLHEVAYGTEKSSEPSLPNLEQLLENVREQEKKAPPLKTEGDLRDGKVVENKKPKLMGMRNKMNYDKKTENK